MADSLSIDRDLTGDVIGTKEAGLKDKEEKDVVVKEEPQELDRKAFLKALGVGLGAVGLDLMTGGRLLAATSPGPEGAGRTEIQGFIRGLLENPEKASEFLESPEAVAKEFGIVLSERDSQKIQDAIYRVAATKTKTRSKIKGKTKLGPGGKMDHDKQSWSKHSESPYKTKGKTKGKMKGKTKTKTSPKMTPR